MQLFGVHGTGNDLAKLTIPEFSPKFALSKLQASENSALFIDFCQISLSDFFSLVNSSIQLKHMATQNNFPLSNVFPGQFRSW